MKQDVVFEHGDVMMSAGYWGKIRDAVNIAIAGCNDIASATEAHQRYGKYTSSELLDKINGDVRRIRNLLEAVLPPF